MGKEEFWKLWKQAHGDLKQEDAARKTFLAAIKALENPKTDYERRGVAKKAIQVFMKFRLVTTKSLEDKNSKSNPTQKFGEGEKEPSPIGFTGGVRLF
jgi:hypothetical protein